MFLNTPGRRWLLAGKKARAWLYFVRVLRSGQEPMRRDNARLELACLHASLSGPFLTSWLHLAVSRRLFRKAASIDKALPFAHERYADDLRERGLTEEALAQYEMCIRKLKKLGDMENFDVALASVYWKRGLLLAQVGQFSSAISECEKGLEYCPSPATPSSVSHRMAEAGLRSLLACCLNVEGDYTAAVEAVDLLLQRPDLDVSAPELCSAARELRTPVELLSNLVTVSPKDIPQISQLFADFYPRLSRCKSWSDFATLRRDFEELHHSRRLVEQVRCNARRVDEAFSACIEELEQQVKRFVAATPSVPELPTELPRIDDTRLRAQLQDLDRAGSRLLTELDRGARLILEAKLLMMRQTRDQWAAWADDEYSLPLRLRIRWRLLQLVRLLTWLLVPVILLNAAMPWLLAKVFPSFAAAVVIALVLAIVAGVPVAFWWDHRITPLCRKLLHDQLSHLTAWAFSVCNGSVEILAVLQERPTPSSPGPPPSK